MTSYGYIIMIVVDSCMIWLDFDFIMQKMQKKSYHIAINVYSRISATTFGDLPDWLYNIYLVNWNMLIFMWSLPINSADSDDPANKYSSI